MKLRLMLILLAMVSCSKETVPPSFEEQLALDVKIIDDYLASQGITNAIEHPSGVRYVIHQAGAGPYAPPTSNLLMSWEVLNLANEQVLDSSYPPVYLNSQLFELIEGFQIAFEFIPSGSTATIYIPSGLGYGALTNGPVPPYTNLIFDVNFRGFTDENSDIFHDFDNNAYVQEFIGSQVWLAGNNRTAKYLNSDLVTDWSNYDDDPTVDQSYGKLYTFAAATDSRGLCPTGFHLPTQEEWESRGMTAMSKTGFQNESGVFSGVGQVAVFWTATDFDATDAMAVTVDLTGLTTAPLNKNSRASVRCVKD